MSNESIMGLFGNLNPQQIRNDALDRSMISPAQMSQQGLLEQVVSMGRNAGTMLGYGGGRMLGGKVAGEVEAGLVNKALEDVNKMGFKDPAQKMAKLGEILSANPATAKQGMIAQQEAVKLKVQGYEMGAMDQAQKLRAAIAAIPADTPVEDRVASINNAIRQYGTTEQQTALVKQELVAAKEKKAVDNRSTALISSFGTAMDSNTILSIASDKALFNKVMEDKHKYREQKTKIITSASGVQLVKDPSGEVIKNYGLPPSGVTINNRQESAEQSARGTMLVEQFKDISDAAKQASNIKSTLQTNLKILDKGLKTGFGTSTIAAAASVLSALGLKDAEKYAGNAQMFTASLNQLVLREQQAQKGPQTESDAKRITATTAQLGNEVDANKFILKVAVAQANKTIAQRQFYADWFEENKTYDGAENAWEAGKGGESLFDSPELKEYAGKTQSSVDQIPGGDQQTAPIYATNPQTNQRIMSTDGGKTWQETR